MAEKAVSGKDVFQQGFLSQANKEAVELAKNTEKLEKALAGVAKQQEVILQQSKDPSSAAAIKERDKALEKSVSTRKQLADVQKVNAKAQKSAKIATTAEIKQKIKLQATNKAIRDSLKDVVALENKNLGTLQRVAIESKKLRRERERLNLETKKGRDRLKEINIQLDRNNKKVQQNSDKLKQQKLNVGNYSDSIKNAAASSGLFSRQLFILSQIQATVGALTKKNTVETTANAAATNAAAKSSGVFSKALRILKIALISTGIGAIVVLLGSLVAAFATTQRGSDALSRAFTPIQVAFEKFVGFLQRVGFAIFDRLKEAFENPGQAIKDLGDLILTNIINRFTALADAGKGIGKVLKGIFEQDFDLIAEGGKDVANAALQAVTGIKDIAGAIKSTAQSISEEVAQANVEAQTLVDLQIKFERLQIDTTVALAKARFEMQQQRGIAQDQLKTDEERIVALNKAEEQLRFIAKTEKDLLSLQIQKLELEQTFNDTDREGELELATLKAELFEKDSQAQKKINSLIAQRSSLELRSNREKEKGVSLTEKELGLRQKELKLRDELNKKAVETDKINEIKTLETELIKLDNLKNQGVENDQERADKEIEIQKAKLQLILDNEKSTAEDIARARALFDKFEIDQQKKKNDELAADEKKARDKRLDDAKKFTNEVGQELQKRRTAEQQGLDAEIQANSDAIQTQLDLAKDGKANQLTFERAEADKLALEKKQAAAQAQKEQEAIALVEAFFGALKLRQAEVGTTSGQATLKAIADVGQIKLASRVVTQFAKDGNEMVMPSGQGGRVGVDDIPFMLTKQEAVITRDANLSNPGVAKALNDGSFNDMYMPKMNAQNIVIDTTQSTNFAEVLVQNQKQIDLLTSIKNKPTQMLNVNQLNEIIETRVTNGHKKTIVHKPSLLRG